MLRKTQGRFVTKGPPCEERALGAAKPSPPPPTLPLKELRGPLLLGQLTSMVFSRSLENIHISPPRISNGSTCIIIWCPFFLKILLTFGIFFSILLPLELCFHSTLLTESDLLTRFYAWKSLTHYPAIPLCHKNIRYIDISKFGLGPVVLSVTWFSSTLSYQHIYS